MKNGTTKETMQLPKRIEAHVTESKSFKIFASIIPDDWIIRETTERDYGIDCYVEICEDGFVTGKMILIQLKGTDGIVFLGSEDNKYVAYYGIKPSTFTYWYKLPITTIFVFIDTSTNIIYFENIKSYVRHNFKDFVEENLTSIKIPIKRKLTKELSAPIINYIYYLEDRREFFEFNVVTFISNFEQRLEILLNHLNLDCFLSLEEDDEIAVIDIYRSIQYLSYYLEIEWKIKSLNEMINEGKQAFGSYGLLYELQVSEFVKNVIPIIGEIVDKIVDLVTNKELDYWKNINQLIWRQLKLKNLKSRINEIIKWL
jgi:hypothetical protein